MYQRELVSPEREEVIRHVEYFEIENRRRTRVVVLSVGLIASMAVGGLLTLLASL